MYHTLLLMLVLLATVLPASAQQSPVDRNREAFLRVVNEAFNQGHVRQVLTEVMAPDFVNHSPNGDGNRLASILTIEAYHQAMPDLTLTPEVVIADGDYVTGRFIFAGTFANAFSVPGRDAIAPTGKPVRFVLESIYRFNVDGQAVEEWLLWDNLDLLTQLGVFPGGGAPAAAEATDPESVIQRFYDDFNTGKLESQKALWSDDPTLTLPDGQVLRGYDQVTSFTPGHTHIDIRDVAVSGTTVEWTSVTSTGEQFLLEAVVENGKIQSMRFR